MKMKLLFGILYFGQGIPGAFLASALASHLVLTGQVSRETMAGFLAVILIPWSLKLFLAPLADVFWGYRKWIFTMPLIMAACVLAIPNIGGNMDLLFLAAFLCNMAQAMYDISVDAIAVSVARGETSSASRVRVGEFLGKFVGGAFMIYHDNSSVGGYVFDRRIVILVSGLFQIFLRDPRTA